MDFYVHNAKVFIISVLKKRINFLVILLLASSESLHLEENFFSSAKVRIVSHWAFFLKKVFGSSNDAT